MSVTKTRHEPAERVTLDDLRHRAETVKDLAKSDVKQAVGRIVHEDATRTLVIVVGLVALAASLAFTLGARLTPRGRPIDPR